MRFFFTHRWKRQLIFFSAIIVAMFLLYDIIVHGLSLYKSSKETKFRENKTQTSNSTVRDHVALQYLIQTHRNIESVHYHTKADILQHQDTTSDGFTRNTSVTARNIGESKTDDKVEFQHLYTGSTDCFAAIYQNQTASYTPYKIFIYELPANFNEDLMRYLHLEQCGYGPTFHKEPGVIFTDTWQFTLDVILHHRLLFSPYRTLNPAEADVFYVPFYEALNCFCKSWHNTTYLGEELEKKVISEINRLPYYSQGKPHVLSIAKIEREE